MRESLERSYPLHHVAVLVKDLEAALAFYGEMIGLKVERRWLTPTGTLRSIWLALNANTLLMLEQAPEDARPVKAPYSGWHLIALQIRADERAELIKRFETYGVAVAYQTDFTFYIEDNDGNRIGFSHWPTPRV